MSNAAPYLAAPAKAGPVLRVLLALPILGHMIRDTGRDVDMVFYYLVIFITALVLAVQVWGLPALVLAALSFVPLIFILLFWITLP